MQKQPFELACSPRHELLSPQQIVVDVNPCYCRDGSDHPRFGAHQIDACWAQKRAARPDARMFNALKFRLHSASFVAPSDPSAPHILRLCCGISDYKSHVGTNVVPVVEGDSAAAASAADYLEAAMANVLGVEACVVTLDNKLLLFRRSSAVADFAGFYCVPGGHAEPSRVFKRLLAASPALPFDPAVTLIDEGIPAAAVHAACVHLAEQLRSLGPEQASKLVVEELFASILDEVASELGLPHLARGADGLVADVGISGVMRATAPDQRGKPDLLFCVKLRIPEAAVRDMFNKRAAAGHEDAWEADDGSLLAVDCADVPSLLEKHLVTPASTAAIVAAATWLASLKK